jgi:hypothetical protein
MSEPQVRPSKVKISFKKKLLGDTVSHRFLPRFLHRFLVSSSEICQVDPFPLHLLPCCWSPDGFDTCAARPSIFHGRPLLSCHSNKTQFTTRTKLDIYLQVLTLFDWRLCITCKLLFHALVWIFCMDVFSFTLKRPQFRLARMHLAAPCMTKPSKAPLFWPAQWCR